MAHALTEGGVNHTKAGRWTQLRPTQPSLGMAHALADAGAFAARGVRRRRRGGSASGHSMARRPVGIDSDYCTSAQDCRSQLAHVPSRLPNWLREPLAVSGRPARRYGASCDLRFGQEQTDIAGANRHWWLPCRAPRQAAVTPSTSKQYSP